jgi:hypothetical protein
MRYNRLIFFYGPIWHFLGQPMTRKWKPGLSNLTQSLFALPGANPHNLDILTSPLRQPAGA